MAVVKKQFVDICYGTHAERITFTQMLLSDKFFEKDTGLIYEYDGTTWVEHMEDTVIIGSNDMELYGADTSTRPDADTVPAGASFMVVSATPSVAMSDGTSWIDL